MRRRQPVLVEHFPAARSPALVLAPIPTRLSAFLPLRRIGSIGHADETTKRQAHSQISSRNSHKGPRSIAHEDVMPFLPRKIKH